MEKAPPLAQADSRPNLPAPERSGSRGGSPAAGQIWPQPPPLRPRVVFGLGTALGLFFVTEAFATTYVEYPNTPLSDWIYTFVCQLYRGWIWAGLTPLVFFLAREFRRRIQSRFVRVVLHVAAASFLLLVVNFVRLWATGLTCGYWDFSTYTIQNTLDQLGPHTVVDFYVYWAILGVAYVRDLAATKRQTELRAEQLRTQLVFAELGALKQQVQPHFLFNSLNAVSALMRDGDSARAQEALTLLATLLRSLLATAGQAEIELRRELDYAECYLAIEKVRFEERLIATFDVEEECLEAFVPTLILQPLIENAVKHGIARRLHPGIVRVSARRVGDRLQLQVANDVADHADVEGHGESYGIGLRATRTRLGHLFGTGFRLDCRFNKEGEALVTIELPLHVAAEGVAR
jgi:two-component system LytT family sensor kinase